MADQPEKEKELAIRGDAKYRFVKGTGQWEEPVAPVKPTELDGTKLPVHWYLDPPKIGANEALDPKPNDDNNQKKIERGKAHPIKWYVKVPGGGGDHPHDDYSYHSPPWDGHGSSSSSMSPPYSSTPSEDTSGGGYGLPLPTGFDPNGSILAAIGEAAPSDVTNAPSQQVQFSGAPPASPTLSQRFNVFPYRVNLLPMAFRTFRKIKGISDLEVHLWAKAAGAVPEFESVEMNVTLIPMEDLSPPVNVYRKAFIVDPSWPSGAAGAWKKQVITFSGFPRDQEFPVTFNIARRSDVTPNYNTEIWVMFTLITGVR